MARGPYFTYRPGAFSERMFGGDPFATLQRELNRVFDDLDLPAMRSGQGGGMGSLSVDVSETPEALKVCADLPGVAEKDVDITLNEDVLTIRGERSSERKAERENFHTVERSTGAFQRSIRLPFPVDADGVRASFASGVLTVTLPKLKTPERSRKIPIGGASDASPTSGAPTSGSATGGAGDLGFIQGDGAVGPSPSTGAGAEPQTASDPENAARPGGAVHGYNE